jgi:hypothetical protein
MELQSQRKAAVTPYGTSAHRYSTILERDGVSSRAVGAGLFKQLYIQKDLNVYSEITYIVGIV